MQQHPPAAQRPLAAFCPAVCWLQFLIHSTFVFVVVRKAPDFHFAAKLTEKYSWNTDDASISAPWSSHFYYAWPRKSEAVK